MFKRNEMTPWIRVVQPYTGGGKGFYFIPEIGEEVLVDFEDQNAERPFVIGSNYNGKEFSKYHTAGNDKKVIHTRSGTKIILNDGEGSVFIEDPSGNTYLMDGQGNINVSAPKNISFTAGEDLIINAKRNMITNVGEDKSDSVGMNYTENIGALKTSSVLGDTKICITGNLLEIIEGNLVSEVKETREEFASEIENFSQEGSIYQNAQKNIVNNSGEKSNNF